ncbi:MAG: hypothetical protein U0487_01825 [Patescibacteria group bacterium]
MRKKGSVQPQQVRPTAPAAAPPSVSEQGEQIIKWLTLGLTLITATTPFAILYVSESPPPSRPILEMSWMGEGSLVGAPRDGIYLQNLGGSAGEIQDFLLLYRQHEFRAANGKNAWANLRAYQERMGVTVPSRPDLFMNGNATRWIAHGTDQFRYPLYALGTRRPQPHDGGMTPDDSAYVADAAALIHLKQELGVAACYCSTDGRCWWYCMRAGDDHETKVDDCESQQYVCPDETETAQ